jgi:hypothetical protein
MTQDQIDALRSFYSTETTDDIQPNFDDVKVVADSIEKIVSLSEAVGDISQLLDNPALIADITGINEKVAEILTTGIAVEMAKNEASESKSRSYDYMMMAQDYMIHINEMDDKYKSMTLKTVSCDTLVSYDYDSNTLSVPQGKQGEKGERPLLSVDVDGNLIVSYEDDVDYNVVGVY